MVTQPSEFEINDSLKRSGIRYAHEVIITTCPSYAFDTRLPRGDALKPDSTRAAAMRNVWSRPRGRANCVNEGEEIKGAWRRGRFEDYMGMRRMKGRRIGGREVWIEGDEGSGADGSSVGFHRDELKVSLGF